MNIYSPDQEFIDSIQQWMKENPETQKFPIFELGSQKGKLNSFYGKNHTEQSKKLIKNQKGWKHSDSSKEKMRLSKIGIKKSKEICKKISDANSGEKHHMWNKKTPEEVIQKIKDTKKKNPYKHNDEAKKKISEAAKLREEKKRCLI